jgi:tetratricopeptide (TPR) repeat protein
MTKQSLRPALLALSALALSAGLFAQTPPPPLAIPQASPVATLKQRVGITDIEIVYSRPSMKGRQIFGGLERWGEVWRVGANNATSVTFSTAVTIGGKQLPPGTYGLFAEIGPDEWTVIFNKIAKQWGAYQYNPQDDVARVTVKPVALAQAVETFTIDLNDLRDESATLNLIWEKTRVPVKLEFEVVATVVPQIEAAMAAPDGRKPYVDAAMFYLEHKLDLNKALEWMNAALAKSPKSFGLLYRKAKIQAAMGDKPGAIATANQAIDLAKADPSPAGPEYVGLDQALISSLK